MIRRLTLALVLPAVLHAQDFRKQVDALRDAMVAAFNADPASIAKLYTDDAVAVGGGMRVVGRREIDEYWKGIPRGATLKVQVLDVGGAPDAPWMHGRSTITTAGDAGSAEFIALLQRAADGSLRLRTDGVAVGDGKAAAGDEAAVRKLDSLWARMYAKNDTAAALRLYAEDLAFRGVRGAIKSRAEELRDVRATPGLTMDYFRTAGATVKTFDRIAVVSGTAEWRFTQNGSSSQYSFPYVAVYARGGPLGWQIIAMHMNPNPAR